jgi:hypothetical protein
LWEPCRKIQLTDPRQVHKPAGQWRCHIPCAVA